MRQTDSEIQQAVLRELRWDTRVEETEIGVGVDDAIVTLTGDVSSWAKRLAAQEAAHRVRGVLDVANDVRVKIPGSKVRSDKDIAGAVRAALEWDVYVPEERIHSTVANGWVTLDGEVEYWSQKEDVSRAIRNLSGVRGVTNRVDVKPPTLVASDIRQSIEEALERQAEREAKRIKLRVEDGKVRLDGVVHSWAEKEAIIGAATGTPGVKGVESYLRIEPHPV